MYYNNESDEALIERVKKGDCEAFSPLIERYKMLVYRLVYRMLGNRDDTEDLVQEVFIKAYNSIKSFKSGSPFSPWLSKIAVNLTINFIKKEKRGHLESLDRVQNQISSNKDDPVEMTRSKLLKEKIQEAMSRLPEIYRAVLVLRIEEELSYEEIGKILNIPKGTVMSRLARARECLKETFEEMGIGS